jgi:tetratricopeptide (TPR) repeat protein
MNMKNANRALCLVLLVTLSIATGGCATTSSGPLPTLSTAQASAYSLKESGDLEVNVSPAGQTMRIGGITGTVIGAGIDASVNSKYRRALEEALGDFDPSKEFSERLSERLVDAVSGTTKHVQPLGSTTRYANRREAELARYANLGKGGAEVLLELNTAAGLYGTSGLVIAKVEGELVHLPRGKKLWSGDILASGEPILANTPLGDPTRAALAPNLSNPRLKAEGDAISQWTDDGGEALRAALKGAMDGAVSATLCDLGLAEEADGFYYLGKRALLVKKFDIAQEHFEKCLQLEPGRLDARNALTVVSAHQDNVDGAARAAKALLSDDAEYGPAWYNLAWWYAIELEEFDHAETCYDRALALGMAPSKKIEDALE